MKLIHGRPMAAFAAVLFAGLGARQEASRDGAPCDLATVEQTPYCEACDRIDPQVDAEGKCVECKRAPVAVEVCVKKMLVCTGCRKPVREAPCCEGASLKESTVKARVVLRCPVCGMDGTEAGQKCAKEGCTGTIVRTCDRSGTWPHGGVAPEK